MSAPVTNPIRVQPRWNVWRFLFTDGNIIDVETPYYADSTDREVALREAGRRWGKDETRGIAGVAQLNTSTTPATPEPATRAKRTPGS